MKTTLTQKEIFKIVQKHLGLTAVYYKMPKKHLLTFVQEALNGNNERWVPVAEEVVRLENRNKNLKNLIG